MISTSFNVFQDSTSPSNFVAKVMPPGTHGLLNSPAAKRASVDQWSVYLMTDDWWWWMTSWWFQAPNRDEHILKKWNHHPDDDGGGGDDYVN